MRTEWERERKSERKKEETGRKILIYWMILIHPEVRGQAEFSSQEMHPYLPCVLQIPNYVGHLHSFPGLLAKSWNRRKAEKLGPEPVIWCY